MVRITRAHNVTITSTRGCTNAHARKTTDEPWRPANRCVRKTKKQGWGKTVVRYCTRRYVPVHALRTGGIRWRRRQRRPSQVQGRAERPVSSATCARGLAQSHSLLSVHDRNTDRLLYRFLSIQRFMTATVPSKRKHNCALSRYLIASNPPVFALPYKTV